MCGVRDAHFRPVETAELRVHRSRKGRKSYSLVCGYRYVWHGPDGVKMGMRGIYREIVVPERIVSTESFDEAWYPGEAVGTLVLTEEAGRTTLTNTVRYDSNATRDAVLKSPMEDGVAYGYDRLAEFLATLQGVQS